MPEQCLWPRFLMSILGNFKWVFAFIGVINQSCPNKLIIQWTVISFWRFFYSNNFEYFLYFGEIFFSNWSDQRIPQFKLLPWILFVCLEDVLKDELLLDIYPVILVDMFEVNKNDTTNVVQNELQRLWSIMKCSTSHHAFALFWGILCMIPMLFSLTMMIYC